MNKKLALYAYYVAVATWTASFFSWMYAGVAILNHGFINNVILDLVLFALVGIMVIVSVYAIMFYWKRTEDIRNQIYQEERRNRPLPWNP